MTISIPSDAELWEVVAAIQVLQSIGCGDAETDFQDQEATKLVSLAGICQWTSSQGGCDHTEALQTAKAYRAVESSQESYQAVLARSTGLERRFLRAPVFPNAGIKPSVSGGIVICPFEINDVFKLPWQVWQALIRHCRTYGLPVTLLGRRGQRADYATFTEGSILSGLPLLDKMQALASAKLVLGVPNEWTWMATAWKKQIAVMYPDDVPNDRWFGFGLEPRTLGRILYTRTQIQVPVILAGLRKMIEVF